MKLRFWRTGCQLCQIFMNRHIYVPFFPDRKVTQHPTCKSTGGFRKHYSRLFMMCGEGNLIYKIFGVLQ